MCFIKILIELHDCLEINFLQEKWKFGFLFLLPKNVIFQFIQLLCLTWSKNCSLLGKLCLSKKNYLNLEIFNSVNWYLNPKLIKTECSLFTNFMLIKNN